MCRCSASVTRKFQNHDMTNLGVGRSFVGSNISTLWQMACIMACFDAVTTTSGRCLFKMDFAAMEELKSTIMSQAGHSNLVLEAKPTANVFGRV